MTDSQPIFVYIACPYTKGDVAENVANSMHAWDQLYDAGFIPFNPLFSHFQHLHRQRPYQDWTRYDNAWIPKCDAILRLPGESSGAEKEVSLAWSIGSPVFHSFAELCEWADQRKIGAAT